jgi:hypothetical protein
MFSSKAANRCAGPHFCSLVVEGEVGRMQSNDFEVLDHGSGKGERRERPSAAAAANSPSLHCGCACLSTGIFLDGRASPYYSECILDLTWIEKNESS